MNIDTTTCFSKFTILVVDDQPIVCESVKEILSSVATVFTTSTGQDAIAFGLQHQPDLLVLDVSMPQMSGVEVCRFYKSHPRLADIPIIFLTGTACSKTEKHCWQIGGSDYLTKPTATDNLVFRIQLYLSMKNRATTARQQHAALASNAAANTQNWCYDFLQSQCDVASRRKMPFGVAFVAIDHLDDVVVQHGRAETDACITDLAKLTSTTLRRSADVMMRYDRDSFLCILSDSGPEGMRHFAYLLNREMAKIQQIKKRQGLPSLTISIGGIANPGIKINATSLLRQAEIQKQKARKLLGNSMAVSIVNNNNVHFQGSTLFS